jgi:hypothetical protein
VHYAVKYRLRADHAARDRDLLDEAYRELAVRRPDWLCCESFQLDDDGSMIFLIEIEHIEWMERTPALASYLTGLAERCEGEPRAGQIDRSGIDVTDAIAVGLWDPLRPAPEPSAD